VTEQFHFDPDTYLDMVRSEVPDYDRLQDLIATAGADVVARAILDLGTGTGVTAIAVAARHPGAALVGVDASPAMLEVARSALPRATFVVGELDDPLPAGPFDLVISALAIHHLRGERKRALFGRIHDVLEPGGRFVFGDVVVPPDPADVVTPVEDGYDHPSPLSDQLAWLGAVGLAPTVVWNERDLAVVAADKAAAPG
jgi:tRNA (cmo5U34)-methyltransferase